MRAVCCLVAVIVAACVFTTTRGAKIQMRDPDAKHEGDGTADWAEQLKRLQQLLPDDAEWGKSISDVLRTHKGETLDICGFTQVSCTVHHEVDTLVIEHAHGSIVWDKLPGTVAFVTFTQSNFDTLFTLEGVPAWVQSLRFYGCTFGKQRPAIGADTAAAPNKGKSGDENTTPRMHELVCESCGLESVPWDALPGLMVLNLANNMLKGVPMASLPKGLRFLNLSHASAEPVAPWGALPSTLVSLDVSFGGLTTIGAVPAALEVLVVSHNNIAGPLDVTGLPASLRTLDVSFNKLTGTVPSLVHLSALRQFAADHNQLTGYDVKNFPTGILRIDLSSNEITGALDTAQLPKQIHTFAIGFNKLAGELDLTKLPQNIDTFDVQSNQLSGRVVLIVLPSSMRFLYLQNNRFTGRPDLSKLPVDLRRIMFGNNSWDSLMPPR